MKITTLLEIVRIGSGDKMTTETISKKELLINKTNEVLNQYSTRLTLRQVYYRLVAKHIIENTEYQYKYLSRILVAARKENLINSYKIVDLTRKPILEKYWYETSEEHLKGVLEELENDIIRYHVHKWHKQKEYVEVWLEKAALETLFREITFERDVTLVTCRGYPSYTLIEESARRILEECENREVDKVTILYFGDYDPTGKDIPRHIEDELKESGISLNLELISLTIDQIDSYELPPVPTKKSDSRSKNFIEQHGDIAVELDALEPDVLQKILEDTILDHFDLAVYEQIENKRQTEISKLKEKAAEILKKVGVE